MLYCTILYYCRRMKHHELKKIIPAQCNRAVQARSGAKGVELVLERDHIRPKQICGGDGVDGMATVS